MLDQLIELCLRSVHILFGLLWFALIAFPTLVSGPALATLAPPDRSKAFLAMVMRQTMWAVLSAMGTLLTGVVLVFHLYLETGTGLGGDNALWALFGGALGFAVFIIGMTRLRPSALQLREILLGNAQGDPAALGLRISKTGRVMFLHMMAALICMILAGHPYLPFTALNAALVILFSAALGIGLLVLVPRLGASQS